jgi:hypothetical protein
MAMSSTYQNAIGDAGGALMTYLGLVDAGGTELTGGSYARLAVTWTAASGGMIRPSADKAFSVPACTVGGWRAYGHATNATPAYGGGDLTQETFAAPGTYTLLAASTGVDHNPA